jgi:hypothetical protein
MTYVTAQRNRDLASRNHGKLNGFKFHKVFVTVDWFEGEVRLKFPSEIGTAQQENPVDYTPVGEFISPYVSLAAILVAAIVIGYVTD